MILEFMFCVVVKNFVYLVDFLPGGGRLLKASRHLGSFVRGVAVAAAGLSPTLFLAGCTPEAPVYHWDDAEKALDDYHGYCMELCKEGATGMEDIASGIVQWLEMEDSVLSCIRRDTAALRKAHKYPYEDLRILHNMTCREYLNKAKAKPRSLDDLITLKSVVIGCRPDRHASDVAASVEPFFKELDGIGIYNEEAGTVIRQYRQLLDKADKDGIRTFTELRAFMWEEDRLFRSFVRRMCEMDGISVGDITAKTNRIYARSWSLLATDSSRLDTMAVMTAMRSNRRLLLCAEACLDDIKGGRVKSPDVRRAYYWMMLRPFTMMDNLGYLILSGEDRDRLRRLAGDVPPVARSIEAEAGDGDAVMDRLPDLLVRAFIASL